MPIVAYNPFKILVQSLIFLHNVLPTIVISIPVILRWDGLGSSAILVPTLCGVAGRVIYAVLEDVDIDAIAEYVVVFSMSGG